MSAAIYLGPRRPAELVEAITSAGGRLTEDPARAGAIVWFGGDPDQLAAVTPAGLRWLQLPSAGVESWLPSLPTGPVVTSATGSYAGTVAEQALALLLAGVRRLPELARRQHWVRTPVGSLTGASVGIVGCGGIGRALIGLLAPFDTRIHAVTRTGTAVPGATTTVSAERLSEALAASDHVVVAAPATAATAGLIGRAELARLRPHSWLVNVARGSLVDTDALVAALRADAIGGAALDVTEPEPLPDGHPLWTLPNVLITPHAANPDHQLLPGLARRVHDNVRRFLADQPLVAVVEPERGY